MKFKVIISLLIVLFLSSCKDNTDKRNTNSINNENNVNKVEDSLITAEYLAKFKSLYSKLIKIKEEEDFKKYGFAIGGPYNEWLKKVEKLKKDPKSDLLLKKGILFGELEQLGLEYVSSNGNETELTKYFKGEFEKAFAKTKKPIEKKSYNYEKIKSEYDLFGKWKINNEVVNSEYIYEIYSLNDQYIGIALYDEPKFEELNKEGTKFIIKGNKYGEYYIINTKKEMILFDSSGELTSMGYEAKFIE
jgi:hypothetical protein